MADVLQTPVGVKLVSMPWPNGASPLHFVLHRPDTRMLRMLLAIPGVPAMAVRADAMGITPLRLAILSGSRESLKCLLVLPEVQASIAADLAGKEWNPLLFAITHKRLGAVTEMLTLPAVKDFVVANDLQLFCYCLVHDQGQILAQLARSVKHTRGLTNEQLTERIDLAFQSVISSDTQETVSEKG